MIHAVRQFAVQTTQTDGQLLEAYTACRDGDAFAELVRRHGPMVWGVCRRMLPNRQDAEDAFQTTFLVLVRKPHSVSPATRVGNWLHGVAVRAALKARAARARRHECQVEMVPEPVSVPDRPYHDTLPVLDEELALLPGRYRAVLVLCELEGKTRKEVARQLEVPEGTVAGWLVRARAMLGKRLARRGVCTPCGALAVLASAHVAPADVPASVVRSTIHAAPAYVLGQPDVTPVGVAALTEGVVRAMSITKLKTASVVALALLGAVASGAAVLVRPTAPAQPTRSENGEPHAVPSPMKVAREERTTSEKGAAGSRPVRSPDAPGPTYYQALFERSLDVIADYFDQITSANPYDGRIEARQLVGNRTIRVEFSGSAEGRFAIYVCAQREALEGEPAVRDTELEQTILLRLGARPDDRPAVPPSSTGSRARDAHTDDRVESLQKELAELREKVKALEKRLSDSEKKDR